MLLFLPTHQLILQFSDLCHCLGNTVLLSGNSDLVLVEGEWRDVHSGSSGLAKRLHHGIVRSHYEWMQLLGDLQPLKR